MVAAIVNERVGHQLSALSRLSSLTTGQESKLRGAFELFTSESLNQPIQGSFPGLSRINADGLPFQWVLHLDRLGATFGFLCEAGSPGDHPYDRFVLSRSRLASARELSAPSDGWLDAITAILIPAREMWPPHWRSAFWIGVVTTPRGLLLKPYFNLNAGSAHDRWLRAGRTLQALGHSESLAALCDLSARVSQGSWPVGLTVDVLPDGTPGRVKVYFRSDAVTLDWLGRWYESTGHREHTALARRFLDLFPLVQQRRYPPAAFTLALEFHPDSAALGLKTDLAITKWMPCDADVRAGARAMVNHVHGSPEQLDEYLNAAGALPADSERTRSFRFAGLGHEPNGESHLNLYLEPCLEPCGTPHRISVRRRQLSIEDALGAAASFVISAGQGEFWSDFELPVGPSTAWVTAYTLARLALVPRALLPREGPARIAEALDWLVRVQSTTGGWGYNTTLPADADSTAWSIIALRRHHCAVPPEARRFLERCRHPNGGFTTYPLGNSTEQRWVAVAPDVSAVAMQAVEEPWSSAAEVLFHQHSANGLPCAYWWASRFYTLAVLLEGYPELASTTRITAMAASLQRVDAPNAFDTALLLAALVPINPPRARAIAAELCREQRPDGSWRSSALLRLPGPENAIPWQTIAAEPLFRDQNSIFTTATSMAALAMLVSAPATVAQHSGLGWTSGHISSSG